MTRPELLAWRARAQALWMARSARERQLLAILAVLLLIAVAIAGIIRPFEARRAMLKADIARSDALAARLGAAGPGLALPAGRRNGAATAIVTDSATAAGLSLARIEPEGGRVHVVVTEAPFNGILRWIADLERTSALRVMEIKLERRPAPGVVGADVTLSNG